MDHPIKRDHARFRRIVKGRVRENLRRYVSQGEQIVPKGNGKFTVPMPSIDIPRFKFGGKSQGGTGQGEGQPGEPVENGQPGEPGQGEAGEGEGNKELEVEMNVEELAQILSEELELPNIQPKGKKQLTSTVEDRKSVV